jgi:hypothetical protein
MTNLASLLQKRRPDGLAYQQAAQLCQRLFVSVAGVPEDCLPKNGAEQADTFAELARCGWVRESDSCFRALYGAHFHEITDRGHWLEVMACVVKNPERVDLTRAENVAEMVGFERKKRYDQGA